MVTKEESTFLKALFMLTVVLSHSLSRYFYPSETTKIIVATLCNNVGMFGFTFLSGYGIYISTRKTFENFWEKRIVNVYVPTLIANILAIVGLEIIGNSYTRLEIYDSIFMISQDNQIQGPIWYIPFIFSWYLIFYIIELISKNNKSLAIFVGGL